MNQSVTQWPQHQQIPRDRSWSDSARGWAEPFGRATNRAPATIGLLIRGVLEAIAGVGLGLGHLMLALTSLAVGILAVPLLIFGALFCLVLSFNVASWVFESMGLL